MDKTISKSEKDVRPRPHTQRRVPPNHSSANTLAAAQVPRCSLSAMAFLLSELVQYTTARCASHEELVSRLMNAGFEVGRRCIELVSYRCARSPKPESSPSALRRVRHAHLFACFAASICGRGSSALVSSCSLP